MTGLQQMRPHRTSADWPREPIAGPSGTGDSLELILSISKPFVPFAEGSPVSDASAAVTDLFGQYVRSNREKRRAEGVPWTESLQRPGAQGAQTSEH
jgi:hypothetical protein